MIKTPSRIGLTASNIGLSSVMTEVKGMKCLGEVRRHNTAKQRENSSILRTVTYDLEIDIHLSVAKREVTEHFRYEACLIKNTLPYIQKSTINNMLNALGDRGNSKFRVFFCMRDCYIDS